MKKTTIIIILLGFMLPVYCQTDVYLRINHKIGYNAYSPDVVVRADSNGNAYKFSRVEYYLSSFALVHDSGQTTPIADRYLLVNANENTEAYLGNFNIQNLEAIDFAVGVDSSNNHLDPNIWPSNHPLAPKFPSMHWGWAAGYRFVAIEGQSGNNFNGFFTVHGLGDSNYKISRHQATGFRENGDLIINLDADYEMIFKGMVVSGNLFNHGEFNEARTVISNFGDFVYNGITVGLNEAQDQDLKISLFPNPSHGDVFIRYKASSNDLTFRVFDIKGKEVQSNRLEGQEIQKIRLDNEGIYIVSFYKGGKLIDNEKIIIQ